MVRRLAGLVSVALLVLVPATSASAAPEGTAKAGGAGNQLVVKVLAAKVDLNADGTVSVPLRVRCSPPLDAFELDVSVRQGTTFGSVSSEK